MFFTIFPIHIQLILARYIELRTLYEAREGPSRTYSWTVFLFSNIVSEFPSQTIMAVLTFFPWYYALGWDTTPNATAPQTERGGLVFFFTWIFMLWTQTFAQMLGSLVPNVPGGIALANVLFILSVLFSG